MISKATISLLSFGLFFGASVILGADDRQACIDNAVIACFDGCTNPLNLQECIIGCSAGGSNDLSICQSNCFGDAFCQSKCQQSVYAISTCAYVTGLVKVLGGTVVLNRATSVWQQTVLITNTSSTYTIANGGFVLDSLASGWKLLNGDGVTIGLPPSGSPYKNLPVLAPGASITVTLQFSRMASTSSTPAFGYMTRVVDSPSR